MITKFRNLWKKFASREYREAFVESHISSTVAAQIQTIRQNRGWSQSELAERADMKQSRISVLEDPNNTSVSVTTLRRIASAFDVGLIVRFVPYSELARWSADSHDGKFSVVQFSEDAMPLAMDDLRPPIVNFGTSADPPIKIHHIGHAEAIAEYKTTSAGSGVWSNARH